jgi:hypothetical protein
MHRCDDILAVTVGMAVEYTLAIVALGDAEARVPIVVRWAGTVGFVAPSTAHQVALDMREGEPTRLVMEPPGIALHVYQASTGVVSHVVPIGDFGPIRDFELAAEYPGR